MVAYIWPERGQRLFGGLGPLFVAIRLFLKTRAIALMPLAILLMLFTHPASACEDGHWIDHVLNDGAVIVLEDGSVWLVASVDRADSALWLPISEIVACETMLINTDDNEKAHAGYASRTDRPDNPRH